MGVGVTCAPFTWGYGVFGITLRKVKLRYYNSVCVLPHCMTVYRWTCQVPSNGASTVLILTVSSYLSLCLPRRPFPSRFQTKIYASFIRPMPVTCPANLTLFLMSHGRSLSVVTMIRAGRRGINSRQEQRSERNGFFLVRHCVHTGSGAHPPPVKWVLGLFPREWSGQGVNWLLTST